MKKQFHFYFWAKIFVILFICSLVVSLVSASLIYTRAYDTIAHELRMKVIGIASTAALQIPGSIHEEILTTDDEKKAPYNTITTILRNIRDANSFTGTNIKYIYTKRKTQDPNTIITVVDAEENPDDMVHVGHEFDIRKKPWHQDFSKTQTSDIYTDQWGTWLSGYAPITDATGLVVGQLGLDIDVREVLNTFQHLRITALSAAIIAVFLAALLSYVVSHSLNKPIAQLQQAVAAIRKGDFDHRISITTRDEFRDLGESFNRMAAGLKERDFIKYSFKRFVSQEILEEILKNPEKAGLGGKTQAVSVLFVDIRGFTSLSEKYAPKSIVSMLNEYFSIIFDVVIANEGMLNKFIGDGGLAIFGAPKPIDDHAERCLKATIEILQRLKEHNIQRRYLKLFTFDASAGINSGQCILGNIGTAERTEYTVIGDNVNIAARIEQIAKQFSVPIVITENTVNKLNTTCPLRTLGKVPLRGREKSISVYEPICELYEGPEAEDLRLFEEAISLFQQRQWHKALGLFKNIGENYPHDTPTALYQRHCLALIKEPPDDSWNGTIGLR